MNRTLSFVRALVAAGAFFITVDSLAQEAPSSDVPRVISYQGLLTSHDGGAVRDGAYPVTVTLYADEAGTKAIWHDTYKAQVVGGVFSVELGSGGTALPTAASLNTQMWVGLRLADGSEMRPLTRMTSAPYALNVADNAITTAKIAPGAVTSDKLGVDYVSEVQVNGEKVSGQGTPLNFIGTGVDFDRATGSVIIGSATGDASSEKKGARAQTPNPGDYWGEAGNVLFGGEWLGTSNATDLEIRVLNEQIMRYQQSGGGGSTPSIVGGDVTNSILALTYGAVIAGGGEGATPESNEIDNFSDYSSISGGAGNLIGQNTQYAAYSVIGGGRNNTVGNTTTDITSATIAGGEENEALEDYSTVGGGESNVASGDWAVVAGGRDNDAIGIYSAVASGWDNDATGNGSFVGAGRGNDAQGVESVIGAGIDNTTTSTYAGILAGHTNVAHDYSAVGAGYNNQADGSHAFIGAGSSNTVAALTQHSAIGGGIGNDVNFNHGFIGGGRDNTVGGVESAIAGGYNNSTTNTYAGVLAGHSNRADLYAAVGGGWTNWADGGHSFIGGGATNNVDAAADYSIVGGGLGNQVLADYGTIGGGSGNRIVAAGINAMIPGGDNLISRSYAQIVAGFYNRAQGAMGWRPTGATVAASDDRLFILGNGDANTLPTPTRSNAFEVSYNGHSIVYDRNGPTSAGLARQPIRGATYTDNVLNAWGHIAGGGAIVSEFGVLKTVPIAVGVVRVVIRVVDPYTAASLSMNANGASITATIVDPVEAVPNPPCRSISTTPLHAWLDPLTGINEPNTFIVTTKEWGSFGCESKDYPFMFKVSGRP